MIFDESAVYQFGRKVNDEAMYFRSGTDKRCCISAGISFMFTH